MTDHSRFLTVLNFCSILILLYSVSLLPPIIFTMFHQYQEISAFFITFLVSVCVGCIGTYSTRKSKKNLQPRDGFLVVVLFWLIFSAFSAMPFVLADHPNLTFVDALFEGISGVTTTGASILTEIDNQPKVILYFRAQLSFIGGLGIIVLAVAIFPLLGIGGAKIYQSETPSAMKEERLTPRLADTAKNLWLIYAGLAVVCAVSYRVAGMNWFDAICHGLTTVSLGGFSTHTASLGFFNSPAIEIVAGVFSILAAINFSLFFIAIGRRSILPILNDTEFRFFIGVVTIVIAVTCTQLYYWGNMPLAASLVHGFFQTASVITSNGFSAGDYPAWPTPTVLLLLLSSFFGGCVGSTCGGIKAMRFLVLFRQSNREIKQLIHPRGFFTLKVDNKPVSDRFIQAVWGFFFLYLISTIFFVFALVLTGVDIITAFGTVAACINNMATGWGETAVTFGGLNDTAKWLMCVAMLFGRLEIFPILILFSRTFWRF